MSLGLEVSLQSMNGSQAPVPSKPTRGQDTLGDLFSAVMAMAMCAVPPTGTPAATAVLSLESATHLPADLSAESSQMALPALSPQASPDQAESAPPVWSAKAPVQAPSGEELPLAAGSDAGERPAPERLLEAGLDRAVLGFAGADDVPPSGKQTSRCEPQPVLSSIATQAESVEGAGRAVVSEQPLFVGVTHGRQVEAAGSLVRVLDAAGADLSVALAATEDVAPKASVDAGVDLGLKAKEALRQAGMKARMATEGAAVADDRKVPKALAATAAKASSAGLQVKTEGKPDRASTEDMTVSSQPASEPEGEGQGGEAGIDEEQSDEVAPVAQYEGTVFGVQRTEPAQVPESVEATREVSLNNVREVADLLREEALKRLPRSVEFRLDPPELGKVTVLLSTRGQDVAVKFVAAAGEAQQVLSNRCGELAEALSERGLTLTGFSVDQGGGDTAGQTRGRESEAGPWGRQSRRAAEVRGALGTVAAAERRGTGVFDHLA